MAAATAGRGAQFSTCRHEPRNEQAASAHGTLTREMIFASMRKEPTILLAAES